MRTTVRLPDDLLRRARKKAQAEGRTLTGLIEEGMRRVVDRAPGEPPALPPISAERGRVLVDLSSTASVANALDEDVPFEQRR